jgi:hypothetical protein
MTGLNLAPFGLEECRKNLKRKILGIFGLEISSLAGVVHERPCRAAALLFAGLVAIQSGS